MSMKMAKNPLWTSILGERVAIKVIKRRSSLENELNAHKLSHENVTKIKDVIDEANDDEDKCAIVVLEYVGQFNLKALLEQKSSELTSKVVKRYAIILTKLPIIIRNSYKIAQNET